MDFEIIEAQLMKHEGEKLKPYRCSAGKLTIGIGRNLDDNGISEEESMFLLDNDIIACSQDLSLLIFPKKFDNFPENIQHVLIDMRFQLGRKGFRSFKKMIFAFQNFDYPGAIKEMKDSKWYKQTTERANNLIEMVAKEISNANINTGN